MLPGVYFFSTSTRRGVSDADADHVVSGVDGSFFSVQKLHLYADFPADDKKGCQS